jgi:hypothetical protein
MAASGIAATCFSLVRRFAIVAFAFNAVWWAR